MRLTLAGSTALTRRRLRPTFLLERCVIYTILIGFSLIFSVPFYWLITTSIKIPDEIFAYPIVWVPSAITLDHYIGAFTIVPLARYISNTMIIAIATVIGAVLSNALIAYGLARIDWSLAKPLFAIFLATMMVPGAVTMIPVYIIFKTLGWLDTYLPLTVPSYFGAAFFIFLLRQFFLTIPLELSDAARIDGASELQIFSRIVLPLAKPALATVALSQFIGSWENFIGPLIYLNNKDLYTIAIGLAMFRNEYGLREIGPLMAASTIMILPVIALFFLTQRTFIQGITLTGLKG